MRLRRCAAAATHVVGTALLSRSLSAEPGSRRFYRATYATAATWAVGGLLSRPRRGPQWTGGGVGQGIAVGVGAFAVFYGCAHVSRRIPLLRRALTGALRHVDEGRTSWVAATTIANGLAEEIFFRGAAQDLFGRKQATALYVAAVAGSRNPALVLAAVIMGSVFAWQRDHTGGLPAPVVAHLTWSMLMLVFVSPLFT